jgi:serine/threonine protein kinase/Tol biopolymer transport system component
MDRSDSNLTPRDVTPGAQLGAYRIEALVGVGGMGEVYRARDTRLDRIVAIKILPPDPGESGERHARFEREARMISQLTHPNICTLHDIGRNNATDFLVMEFLDGDTLAGRLARGRVPLMQALQIGIEIASALDHAHRHGIVHRDIKPSNVMLTKTGAKLLDFGVAKLGRSMAAGASKMTDAPTLNTAEGTLVGTLAYMAPEQLEGKEVDARADIWALGCVLYELATGRRAFDGASQATVIAAILEHEPPAPTTVQPLAPLLLDHVITTCLAKDPDERWQSAADVKRALSWIAKSSDAGPREAMGVPQTRSIGSLAKRRLPWLLAAVLLLALVASAPFVVTSLREHAPEALARLQLVPPKGVWVENVQISPDGRHVAFIGREAGGRNQTRRLWLQALGSTIAAPVPGTENANNPFWAPDSQQLAFYSGLSLKKIAVSGESPQTLCEVGDSAEGTWSRDGVILFHVSRPTDAPLDTKNLGEGLFRVSASGGRPLPATKLDPSRQEIRHLWPHFLPDGRHFLYVVHSADNRWSGLYVGSLDAIEPKRVLDIETAAVYASGHLLFSREGAIVAQPFDLARLELAGEVTQIAHDADYHSQIGPPRFSTSPYNVPGLGVSFMVGLLGAAVFSRSDTGLLAYSLFEPYQYQFGWVDRHGAPLGDVSSRGSFSSFDLSPDAKRLVVTRANIDRANLWLLDLDRNTGAQMTFGRSFEFDPRLEPNGPRVAFTVWRDDGLRQIVSVGLDGKATVVLENATVDHWSIDGRFLLFRRGGIQALPLSGPPTPSVVHRPPAGVPQSIDQSRFSPDGRRVAYNSKESGKDEVFVTKFPATGERTQVSVDGGVQPMWRRDGRELYYLGLDGTMFAVEIKEGERIAAGAPRSLFQATVGAVNPSIEQYATVDGERFLILKPVDRTQRPINIIVNWSALLKK